MYYVYIIRSIKFLNQTYIGFSENLKTRLLDHNNGESIHTKQFKPWKLEAYFAFTNKKKALDFELYLKSGSSRAFREKHF